MMALPASRASFQFLRVLSSSEAKKAEVDVLELFGTDALDETDLVAHGFELAEGFVVIEQANIGGGKVALVEHLGNFFSLEGGGADDGGAVEISAGGGGMRRRR